jgi:hypothetical protein
MKEPSGKSRKSYKESASRKPTASMPRGRKELAYQEVRDFEVRLHKAVTLARTDARSDLETEPGIPYSCGGVKV